MQPLTIHAIPPSLLLLPILSTITTASFFRSSADSSCDTCDLRECPTVVANECDGLIVKDQCDCCPLCIPSDDTDDDVINTYVNASHKEACSKITCSRLQTCTLNIQGIPMCRCPSTFFCRKRSRRDVCAENGTTYRSRCFLRIKECNENTKIRIKHIGPCFADRELKNRKQMGKKGSASAGTVVLRKKNGGGKENVKGDNRRNRQNGAKERRRWRNMLAEKTRSEHEDVVVGKKKEKRKQDRKENKKQERQVQREERRQERKDRKAEKKVMLRDEKRQQRRQEKKQIKRKQRRRVKRRKARKSKRGRRNCIVGEDGMS